MSFLPKTFLFPCQNMIPLKWVRNMTETPLSLSLNLKTLTRMHPATRKLVARCNRVITPLSLTNFTREKSLNRSNFFPTGQLFEEKNCGVNLIHPSSGCCEFRKLGDQRQLDEPKQPRGIQIHLVGSQTSSNKCAIC